MSLEYTLSDGTVEQANSFLEAYKLCPFLGEMSLEQAEVFLEIYQRDDSVFKQNTNDLDNKDRVQESPTSESNDPKPSHARAVDRPVALARPTLESAILISEPVKIEPINIIEFDPQQLPLIETNNTLPDEPAVEDLHIKALGIDATTLDQEVDIIIKRAAPTNPKVYNEPEKVKLDSLVAIASETKTSEADQLTPKPLLIIQEELSSDPVVELDYAVGTEEVITGLELEPEISIPDPIEIEIEDINATLDFDGLETLPQQDESISLESKEVREVKSPIIEATQTIAAIISELAVDEQNQAIALLERLEELVLPSYLTEHEAQEPDIIKIEAELIEIAESLIKLLDLSAEEIDVQNFLKLIIQVLPDLKPMLLNIDLEHDGTKEVKRRYLIKRGDDDGWAMLRLGQIIGMLVLLRSFVILPEQIYYQM